MTFCAKCGKPLQDTQLFCGNCGNKNPYAVQDTAITEAVTTAEEEIIPEETTELITEEAPAEEYTPEPVKVEFEAEPAKPKKQGSAGWLALGLFFPLVGLILFLIWRKKTPRSAKFAGIGAIIGGVLNFISYIALLFAIIIAILASEPEAVAPDTFGKLTEAAISLIIR